MATITTILASDIIASSRVTLNTNFANLNTDKVDIYSTYADPAWITSLAGSKITGNIGGNAATATALATARTIAGVFFDGTANIAIPSTGLSDSPDIVRGASSVASGQVLYGTGAGVAGSSANFRYFVGTGNMVVGTTTDDGTNRLQVAGSVAVTTNIAATRTILSSASAAPQIRLNVTGQSGYWEIYSDFNNTNADLWFRPNGTAATSSFTQVNSSGNWAFGTTAANTFKIDIAASGSSGTLRAYDQTPTTGVTQLLVRAGAGQSTTNLQTWQTSGGATLAVIASTGDFATTGSVQSPFLLGTDNANAYLLMRGAGGGSAFAGLSRSQSQFAVFSDYRIGFLSGTNINASTTGVEIAFSRNSSTAIEINNGTAGTFRDLYLRGVRPVGSTVANLPTASGNTGMIATVTDANSTTIGTTVAGGGANTVLVWSNGTNWRIYAN